MQIIAILNNQPSLIPPPSPQIREAEALLAEPGKRAPASAGLPDRGVAGRVPRQVRGCPGPRPPPPGVSGRPFLRLFPEGPDEDPAVDAVSGRPCGRRAGG